jgi:glutamyl-tRNA reductase
LSTQRRIELKLPSAFVRTEEKSLELSSASFAYPQHDGAIRAELAQRLLAANRVEEGFLLSTCLRIEVVVPGPVDHLDEVLSSLFGEFPGATPQIRRGERAVTHLYRIAAGLESPILGEQEILAQFRQSLIEAEESAQVDGVFARLLESAVGVGRQARELLPASPHNSMAAVAAQAVGTAERVAVLGSGIMATAVVDGLQQLPAPPEVTVVARNPEKVAERAGVEVLPFARASVVLAEFPAVISATSAKHRLVDDVDIAGMVAERVTPLVLIDMAMPPDFKPPTGSNISYLSIDDLARMADRRSRSEEADALVERAAADAYRQYRDHHEIGPLIGGLIDNADEIVDEVVHRFAGRLAEGRDEVVLRQTAHTVARKLLAGPVSYLRQEQRSPEAIDVIADAFGVDDE